jgi:hypothetical protein
MKRITNTLHDDLRTPMILSRWILVRMKNISDKSCRGNQNVLCSIAFFLPRKSCRLWDNVENYCTAWQATDDNRGMSKSTDTHLQYVIPIAFSTATMVARRPPPVIRYKHTTLLFMTPSLHMNAFQMNILFCCKHYEHTLNYSVWDIVQHTKPCVT